MAKEELLQRLGQITIDVAKKQEELRKLQQEANEIATTIEKLNG